MTRSLGCWSAPWWLILAAVANVAAGQETPAAPDPMLADAQLADVAAVDGTHVWAVGDRGVIWHTADGGRTWTLQASGVDCRLSSVFFISDKIGWAAGGYLQPYTHATIGVVLSTRDGGEHWTSLRARVLPAIRRIGFFDAQHGWAVGQTSAYFPTGAYTTSDGGKSWSAVPGGAGGSWLAGDFIDPNTGALAGRASASATVRRRGVEPVPADFGLRALVRMKLSAPGEGWLVGDGGLVLNTRDLGKSWQTTEGSLPPGSSKQFDYGALAVVGRHVWVAGTPGTRVLHSGDSGRTWQAADTAQPLPIRSLAFAGEQHGWAVGDLGTILATADGGRTWRKQRAGGERCAWSGFFSRPDEVPLELVALASADEGYLGTIEILNRELSELRASLDPDALVHEASVRAGASVGGAAWQFPLRSASLKLSADRLVDDWNRANDGEALEKLSAHIVGRIRMWRPSVVVTVGAEARDPLALAVNQIVLSAVEHAADPTRHPEQIAEAGLQPWKVQKVYATLGSGTGTANINAAQVTARLGRTIGELAAPARGLLASQYAPPADNVGFRLLVDHIPQELGQRDFFSGIPLSPGGGARRAYEPTSRNNLEAARREAQRFRNLQGILAQADHDQREGRFLANIADQTRDMEPARAAEVLFQLAERYWVRGRWDMAAECYEVIVERHAQHPLAGASLAWLVQYFASGEAARRGAKSGAPASPQAPSGGVGAVLSGVRQAVGIVEQDQVVPAGGAGTATQDPDERAAKAAGYAEQLEQVEPALAYEPRVRFPVAVAQRRQGNSGNAERFMQALVRNRPPDAWWECAKTEQWLIDRQNQPPKTLWNCRRAAGKPRLDGRLDEPLWRAAEVVELRSAQREDAEWSAVAMLSYDEEFLYVGLSCSRAAGYRYDTSDRPRPRDPDLSDRDRVELFIDVDRDFATYYRLVIDHRGWTGETCWHDATWNPTWFVAAGGDDAEWTAEAAIPFTELVGESPSPATTWAVGMQRTVPGVGFQSWTQPASPEVVPEGFGYLIFQP
jgi:photosystem II stability/assembly factor-like uncharacterized protein